MWSHAAWTQTLGIDVPLLSDWNGEATRAFGIAAQLWEMEDVAARASFLVQDGTIRKSWMLGNELPDIDAVIAAAGR